MNCENKKPTCSRFGETKQGSEEGCIQGRERSTSAALGKSERKTLGTRSFTEKDMIRFWSKVDRDGPLPDQTNPHYVGLDQCWIWTAAKDTHGYGTFQLAGKTVPTHRSAWEITNGAIPKGEGFHGTCVIHACDQRACCNPCHLRLGSIGDNTLDMESKGRGVHPKGDAHGLKKHPERVARGERNGYVKLTASQVIEIRALYAAGGVYQRQLAKRFGVVQTVISRIIRREAWAHVPTDAPDWI